MAADRDADEALQIEEAGRDLRSRLYGASK